MIATWLARSRLTPCFAQDVRQRQDELRVAGIVPMLVHHLASNDDSAVFDEAIRVSVAVLLGGNKKVTHGAMCRCFE